MAGNQQDVADSWEDADTEDLERRMEERRKELKPADKKGKKSEAKMSDGMQRDGQLPSNFEPRLRLQDSERTSYVAPVKILKRQESGSAKTQTTSQPTAVDESKKRKSLAEREAAYASARARILGQPHPSSGNSEAKIPTKSPPFKQSS